MIEIGALLIGTAFFGGNLANTLLGGVLGNTAYDAVKVFCGLRSHLLKPSPQNHDLQKALLQTLENSVQTVTRRNIKGLSLGEKQQVKTWEKHVLQTLKQLKQEIEQDQFAWKVSDDMGMLLSVSYEDLYKVGESEITSELQQFKARYEQSFLKLDTLPAQFRDVFQQEWLASTYLYLAEVIKTEPRVAEIFQTNLLLDTQGRVKNIETLVQGLVECFNNPQHFLGIVQPGVQIDIEGLRSAIADLAVEVQVVKTTTQENLTVSKQTLSEVKRLRKDFVDFQGAQTSYVSTIIDQSRPKVENWQGRKTEMAAIQERLGHVNLIGITGLGGYGKSALATQIYEAASFATKIWVTVSQPYCFGDLGRWLLAQLGVQIDEKTEDEQVAIALVNRLAKTQALVVLDNLETLLNQEQEWLDKSYQPFFAKWLEYGRSSVILITSRERPDLPSNNSYWLPTLKGLHPEDGEQLLRRLDIQGTVAELQAFVSLIDGHPLLLHLAANLLKEELGANEINRFQALTTNLFEVGGLHQGDEVNNVRKLFEASLARLESSLKAVFLNLSIYRLPFNHEAATAQLPGHSDIQMAESDLRRLAKSSLLQERKERDATGKRLFQFQPLLLSYAQQTAVDLAIAHQRAIDYYWMHRKEPDNWQTEAELTEYFEVVHHYCELQQFAHANDVLDFCCQFLDLRGYYRRLVALYRRLAEEWQLPKAEEWTDFGRACARLGNAYHSLGQYSQAIRFHQQHLKISHKIGDRQSKANSLDNLGKVNHSLGRYRCAIKFHQQSLKIVREIPNRLGEASSLGNLGKAYHSLGQYQQAINFHQQSLTISREIIDRLGEANSLGRLGNVYHSLRQYQLAINFNQQSLKIMREIRNRLGEANSLGGLGNVYHSLRQYQLAIDFNRQSLKIVREIGNRQREATFLGNLGKAYHSLGQYQLAIDFHQQQLDINREISNRLGEANSLRGLGNAYHSLGQYQQAINFHQQSSTISREIGNRQGDADSQFKLGIVLSKLGCKTEAIAAYQNARRLYESMKLDADTKDCESAIEKLSKRSNLLVDLLKRMSRCLRLLLQRFW